MTHEGLVRRHRRFRLRAVSWVVLCVFVAAAVGLFFGARRLVSDENQRLLNERASEVALVLSSSLGADFITVVSLLAQSAEQSPQAFQATADQATARNAALISLITRQGGTWVVQATSGSGLTAGQSVTGARETLLARSGAQAHFDIYPVGAKTRLGIVITLPTKPGGVILAEYPVDPAKPTTLTQTQPFHELNVAWYASRHADPSKLVLTTTSKLPLKGQTATADVPLGGDTWLVVASARAPLSGDVASKTPIVVLGALLVIGVAITAVVEGVGRRRDYAMAMVADKTAELRRSLDELENTQQKLVATERLAALGQMAATVGHELRNPLGVLTNAMYLIRGKVAASADERLLRQLDTADREITAATLIVSDLLEFSRPRAANPVQVDVVELLEESVSVAPPPSGIAIEVDRSAVPPLTADRDQIRQVVLNLLTNAYEAMPNGGTVRLGARLSDDRVDIVIEDSGTGIDDEALAHIFEPFFSKKTKGTGLGLAVSKRIVEAHDGTLTLTSSEGHGCTATLSLPLVPVGSGVTQ